jgi:hypothetical protein
MGGFFGCASQEECNKELFYGTDYLSHLGTKRGGMATVDKMGSTGQSIILKMHTFGQNLNQTLIN